MSTNRKIARSKIARNVAATLTASAAAWLAGMNTAVPQAFVPANPPVNTIAGANQYAFNLFLNAVINFHSTLGANLVSPDVGQVRIALDQIGVSMIIGANRSQDIAEKWVLVNRSFAMLGADTDVNTDNILVVLKEIYDLFFLGGGAGPQPVC